MLLENKSAVIYGGSGAVGGAMARAFAAEGARVFLAARTPDKLEVVADEIRRAGGHAETAVVDALDEAAVNDHADAVAGSAGSLDISVNVIAHDDIFQPLAEIPVRDFVESMGKLITTHLLTNRAAARHMVRQGSGVILHFGGSDSANALPGLGTVQVGFDTIEALRRQWACELGAHGVRVISLRTGGIAETIPDSPDTQLMKQELVDRTLLKRAATLTDVGRVAAFVASDHARTMTSTQINISCGALVD